MEFVEWLRSGLTRKNQRIECKLYTPLGLGGEGGLAVYAGWSALPPLFMVRC